MMTRLGKPRHRILEIPLEMFTRNGETMWSLQNLDVVMETQTSMLTLHDLRLGRTRNCQMVKDRVASHRIASLMLHLGLPRLHPLLIVMTTCRLAVLLWLAEMVVWTSISARAAMSCVPSTIARPGERAVVQAGTSMVSRGIAIEGKGVRLKTGILVSVLLIGTMCGHALVEHHIARPELSRLAILAMAVLTMSKHETSEMIADRLLGVIMIDTEVNARDTRCTRIAALVK
jgi:hypothetical protein